MTTWIVCGVLKLEFEDLRQRKLLDGVAVFPASMLHMKPEKIEECIEALINQKDFEKPCVIVYGDCCSKMIDLQQQKGVARIDAVNCVQMLVDRNAYRDLMKREAFIFLPEWAARWKTVFMEELDLTSQAIALEFFRDTRREIVYLNTGLLNPPVNELDNCSEFTGLPWSILQTDPDYFLNLLLDAEKKLK